MTTEPMTEATTDALTATERITEDVRRHYAQAALAATGRERALGHGDGTCCGTDTGSAGTDSWGGILYGEDERAALPEAAVLASMGCGNPTAVAELRPGETVLDLGSGGGIDVLLSAARVGPSGFAYGLDMTDEMLDLAQQNAREAGVENVAFLKGQIESIPLDDASVDVVISNCVVNLSADKAAVLAEVARVLRPGGRIGISDVVADDDLSPAVRAERGSFAGCIAGALSFAEYQAGLTAVGLAEVEVTATHAVGDGLHGAIVRAVKPDGWSAADIRPVDLPRPVRTVPVQASEAGCCGSGGGCC